jgi:cell division cycle protein 20 (cofactor of APC complex)
MIIWNGNTGQKVLDVDTENQVSGIHWNERLREIITCHGYPNNVLRLWKYPKFSHMIDFDGHDGRILCSSQSPCGKYVCSLGEDETLRLWKAFFSEETDTKVQLYLKILCPINVQAKRPGGSRSQTATALSMRF